MTTKEKGQRTLPASPIQSLSPWAELPNDNQNSDGRKAVPWRQTPSVKAADAVNLLAARYPRLSDAARREILYVLFDEFKRLAEEPEAPENRREIWCQDHLNREVWR